MAPGVVYLSDLGHTNSERPIAITWRLEPELATVRLRNYLRLYQWVLGIGCHAGWGNDRDEPQRPRKPDPTAGCLVSCSAKNTRNMRRWGLGVLRGLLELGGVELAV